MGSTTTEAFVTLITNDSYAKGALVLGQSLRASGTNRKLVVLIGYSVQEPWKSALSRTFDLCRDVTLLDSHDSTRLALISRPELGVTFTKLQCWTLTDFSKCVFLDADTLVIENIDSLFQREELSAAPDVGWPDMFNTGVFVFRPSLATYAALLNLAQREGSFDGGDQGLLNTYFSDWAHKDISKHLPFVFNMAANLAYSYLPALLRFGTEVKVVHFLGQAKPWHFQYHQDRDYISGGEGLQQEMVSTTRPFIRTWWQVYNLRVAPLLSRPHDAHAAAPVAPKEAASVNGSNHAAASTNQNQAPNPPANQPIKPSSPNQWEVGHVDYTGQDRFAHIQEHLDSVIKHTGY